MALEVALTNLSMSQEALKIFEATDAKNSQFYHGFTHMIKHVAWLYTQRTDLHEFL